ncbi:MAG: phosphoglycerate kinase [Candidatus Methanofastidiosia archaeon]
MHVIRSDGTRIVLAELRDSIGEFSDVYLRTDINEPPAPSLKVEQAVKTISKIRKFQSKKSNILCTSHSSDKNRSLKENFDILKIELEKQVDPITPEINGIEFVDDFEKLSKANKEKEGCLIFFENIRKIVPEETKPPVNSSGAFLWKYLKNFTKINGALSCCHRDHLSLRVFTDGCYCSDFFVQELQTVTDLYTSSDDNDVKIWGIAGAKTDKLDSIYLTEERDDLIVALDGGPILVLLVWAMAKEVRSLSRILPDNVGPQNKKLIEKFFGGPRWNTIKSKAIQIAKMVEEGAIDVILPIDVIVEDENKEKTVSLSGINKGRFLSLGPNSLTMLGDISARRQFVQTGSVEPKAYLRRGEESTTYNLAKEILRHARTFYINGGDTVSDIRTFEVPLKLQKFRENEKFKELAVGGFVVKWWSFLNTGKNIPPGVRYASIGSFKSLYKKLDSGKGFS